MAAHAILGASGSYRYLNCPGTIRMSANIPPAPSSMYAEEGTAAHTLGERSLVEDRAPAYWLGDFITTDEGNTFEVTQEMVDAVTVYTDHCQTLLVGAQEYGIETRFSLEAFTRKHGIDTDAFGTIDFYVLSQKILYVRDYKHGQGVPVEIEGNTQAMYYALLVLLWLLAEGAQYNLPHTVDIGIVQPRYDRHPEGPIRTRRMSTLDLLLWGDDVLAPGMKAALDPFSPITPGDWCRWCPAQAQCPALHELAKRTAKLDEFTVVPPDPHTFTDQELSDVMDRAELLASFVNACRGEMSARCEQRGAAVGNWKLVDKRAVRKWRSGVDATAVRKVMPPETEEISVNEVKLASVAELERRLRRAGLPFEQIEKALVEKKSSGTTLVPSLDPRQLVLTKGNEFDAVSDE